MRFLPLVEWWYNTTYHTATRTTPYQAVYGVQPPTLISYVPGTTCVQSVEDELRDCDKALQLLKENLQRAQARMKQNTEKHRSERHFDVGDWAYLRLQPYRQSSVTACKSQKPAIRYYRLFQVLE